MTMNRLFITSFILSTLSLNAQAADPVVLSDLADKVSYTIGHQIGTDFQRQNIPLNKNAVRQGLQDGSSNSPPLVSSREMNAALSDLAKKSMTKAQREAMARIENRRKMQKQNQ